MPHLKELPRLTKYLRAYSDVVPRWAGDYSNSPDALVIKRQEKKDKQYRLCTTKTVKEFLYKNSKFSKKEIDDFMAELMGLAKEIAGDHNSSVFLESTITFMLELFRNCTVLGPTQCSELRIRYGQYPHQAAARAFNIAHTLTLSLHPSAYEQFLEEGLPRADEGLLEEEFGAKIKFVEQKPLLDESYYLVPTRDLPEENSNGFKGLSFKFEDIPEPKKEPDPAPPPRAEPVPRTLRHDEEWLKLALKEVAVSETGLSSSELALTVVQLLKMNKTNEELQNELFDLLGFDSFELIQKILIHRDEIIFAKVIEANSKDFSEKRPTCMSQVVIQSETEKLLNKQIRKDEKKIMKEMTKITVEENNPNKLDPQRLKQYREQALLYAQNTPLFSHPSENRVVQNLCFSRYPNVFDLYAETKMLASFVAGRKLALPENSVRVNNSMFEEIRIPATKNIYDQMEWDLVKISSLDKIGQIAFQGTERLNCIQSKVFPVAYNTNHNMLVCAPTGAGKTNVAMLTILHEIKNNFEGGELQKNKFKIVYVAPMKALAAEMVRNFGQRLKPLGIQVKELTGDMQLTKTEIMQTQMLVTTPEKWDVVTRKSTGDIALSQIVKLLILDEVHLLDSDRGPVLEALVARTLRQVETSQSMIRIVGLSATLPNYIDVARFLRVNPMEGLFFFDDRFRPVPLTPTFIGVKANNPFTQANDMDKICYDKVIKLAEKHQVMVFVHARNATYKTASKLIELAKHNDELHFFTPEKSAINLLRTRNRQLQELFDNGFAMHHAGMLRSDRNLVEKFFRDGHIKVLVCTSTLAWGVNLPARGVIIKGTEVYDAKQGKFIDVSVLDVMQIFGRAGRPQFDKLGEGIIITAHDRLSHYLSMLTRQHVIESNFEDKVADNLNAEVALGTVTSVDEGVEWLSYTYLFVRMAINPHGYGLKPSDLENDPTLTKYREKIIKKAATSLYRAEMIRFDRENGYLSVTDKGRTASHYYVSTESITRFNEKFNTDFMTESDVFKMISQAQEFDQLKVREDEMVELDHLLHETYFDVPLGKENTEGKVNILMQSYLSRIPISGFSLISDQTYVAQNATRIARSLFEICLRKSKAMMTGLFLKVSKMLERQIWSSDPPSFQSPLHQFSELGRDLLSKIDRSRLKIDQLQDMDLDDIGKQLRAYRERHIVKRCLECIPNLGIEPVVQPITDSILRITLHIEPDFKWVEKYHGSGSETFWIWILDPGNDYIYHFEYFILPRKQVIHKEIQSLVFTIPLPRDNRPAQYIIRAVSDRWLGSDRQFTMSFDKMILPKHKQPHTDLLNLVPLPKTVLKNKKYEELYSFEYFNPIQTQIFHSLYHTDHNVLLGAPTGSGKTIAAEIAIFRVFNVHPGGKVVYIAPLKALVRERIEDWKVRFGQKLNKKVIELTGDVTPDAAAIAAADIIVTTPEKWDGVSRSWQTRNYVKAVALIAIDEIHLLGEDRGPVLEVIVSRTNFISAQTEKKLRIIGLSTALANATDIGNWLGIKDIGLYNFRSSVRPVQLEIHVSGFHGKHYCPRMALMNKPTYQAIRTHSPDKPALVFVSSRRQTRLTGLDLIAYLAMEPNPRQWMRMEDNEVNAVLSMIRDQNLKLMIAFGIGLHHAGLHEKDRRLVEELFLNRKIQVLIATATLAWGINMPAHLVVIKGTEYFDGKVQRYVDFPVTDVMQMAGRAGRPQFDTTGVAVVLVQDVKKNFYKKFLHDPFPVESSLIGVLPEHLNAEVVAGTICSKQQCVDYITWTYFFRRLIQNPGYYGLESVESLMESINAFLSGLINQCLKLLSDAGCLTVDDDERTVSPTVLGKIASYYYLSHKTILVFTQKMSKEASLEEMLQILCDTHEYEELPVRHNEDATNKEFAQQCPLEVDPLTFDSPHTKANLLFQSHFSRLTLPCTDYNTDLKSVLDQAIRIIQAMIDVCADKGWLIPTLQSMLLMQMILQGRWYYDNTLLTLPHMDMVNLNAFCFSEDGGRESNPFVIDNLPELIAKVTKRHELFSSALKRDLDATQINEIYDILLKLPIISVRSSIKGWWNESDREETRPLKTNRIEGVRPEGQWVQVHADQEYVLVVNLRRDSKFREENKAIAPKFPKQKSEGWFLVLGNTDTRELIAMKRVPFVQRRATHQLMFYTPEMEGKVCYRLFLISDCYLGLDQQYDICLNVIEPSIKAQINTELLSDSSSSEEED